MTTALFLAALVCVGIAVGRTRHRGSSTYSGSSWSDGGGGGSCGSDGGGSGGDC